MSEVVTLGEIAWIEARIVDPTSAKYAPLPHISAENIISLTGEVLNIQSAAEDGMESGKYLFGTGDVLYSKLRPYLRKATIVNFEGLCSADIYPIKSESSKLIPEFLRALLVSDDFTEFANEASARSRMPKINREQLFGYQFKLPPIEKQRQIAARLKVQLTEVEKAHQAAEVQLWDAAALQSAVLKETFLERNSNSWPRVKLGEVGEVVAGITLGRKINGKVTRSIPFLRVANVKDGYLDLSGVSTIEATEAEIERLLLQPGDILLTESGDPDKLGRGTFWNGELKECIHQNHIFRVRFPNESYLPEFIAAQVGSSYGKDYFFAHAKKTTGIATINQKVLKSFPVLSPPVETQKVVMATLNSQLHETGKIINSLTNQLDEINLLPQKILAKAFEK